MVHPEDSRTAALRRMRGYRKTRRIASIQRVLYVCIHLLQYVNQSPMTFTIFVGVL